jgi:predicted metal-dependent phosphoesterase TrpH
VVTQSKHLPRFSRPATVFLIFAALGSAFAADPTQPATRWYRGNIHTHSLWSDGNDFPEMIADWYVKHGYNFLALSDHNVLSKGVRWKKHDEILAKGYMEALEKYRARFGDDWVETRGTPGTPDYEVRLRPLDEFRKLVEKPGEFLMIQSEEISDKAEGVPVHMNATNIEEAIEPQGGKTVAEAIENNLRAVEEQAKQTGKEILVHLNHPNFHYAITAEDIAQVIRERFVEVYNGHPGVGHLGDKNHPSVEEIWDIANTLRVAKFHAPPLYGVATDDSHVYNGKPGSRPGRGWIMVRAAKLEPETLIRAIKAGDFYASSGVTLRDFGYDAATKRLQVEIEPKSGVTYKTQFIGTKIGFNPKSRPRGGKDKKGKPLRSTRQYSHDVGVVLATVEGPTPSYQLTGKELYVRAVVTSSEAPDDPSFDGQFQQAWTQPVGWEARLAETAKAALDK